MAKVTNSRTKERIKKTGEVFTPPGLISDMLKALDETVWEDNKTFCDPAGGDGNIAITILAWKLAEGHNPTEALQTVYAVEMMPDNVERMRTRLLNIVGDTPEHRQIVETNIVCANTLEYDFSFEAA